MGHRPFVPQGISASALSSSPPDDNAFPLHSNQFLVTSRAMFGRMASVFLRNPPESYDSADRIEYERFLLTADQAELLDAFCKEIRLCDSDVDKFQLCAQMRSRLLDQHTQVELLIAFVERTMLDECPKYGNYKKNKGKKTTDPDTAEWGRFIDIAASGSVAIQKFLPQLKAVSVCWGREKLEYYNWPARGWKFCRTLGAVARKMGWPEFVIKANRLLLRRQLMPRKYRRLPIRDSLDPLDQVELDNLGRWLGEGPFVKDKDPENVLLPFRDITAEELPAGFGFDEYGLMVLKKVAVTLPEGYEANAAERPGSEPREPSPTDSEFERAVSTVVDDIMANIPTERDATDTTEPSSALSEASGPTVAVNENIGSAGSPFDIPSTELSSTLSSSPDSPVASPSSAMEISSADDAPASCRGGNTTRAPADITAPNDGDNLDDCQLTADDLFGQILCSRAKPIGSETNGGNSKAATGTTRDAGDGQHPTDDAMRLRRRTVQPAYRETPNSKSSKLIRRQPVPFDTATLQEKRCCPPKIPPKLLAILENFAVVSTSRHPLPVFMQLEGKDVPYQSMCHSHLQKFAEAIAKMEVLEPPLKAEKDLQMASADRSPNRRRRTSLSDITDNTPLKKLRLDEPGLPIQGTLPVTAAQDGCPKYDRIRDQAYRQQMLRELESARLEPDSHGGQTNILIREILLKSKQPATDEKLGTAEAYFCAGDEATMKAEIGLVDAPVSRAKHFVKFEIGSLTSSQQRIPGTFSIFGTRCLRSCHLSWKERTADFSSKYAMRF